LTFTCRLIQNAVMGLRKCRSVNLLLPLIVLFTSFSAWTSPSQASQTPTVSLSVSTKLDNNQLIVVSFSGLLPNEQTKIQQCARDATTSDQCGGTSFVTADAQGNGNIVFRITRTNDLDITVPMAPFLQCDVVNLCEIRAFPVSDPSRSASTPITFVPGPGGCPQGLAGSVTGKGTAGMARAFAAWGPFICESPVSVSVDYVAESDKFGLTDMQCGLVDYAITDHETGNPTCNLGDKKTEIAGLAPLALTGITFAINMRDGNGQRISELKLTPTHLARIFTGKLGTLDIPEIRALNPGITLPNKLNVAVRADQAAITLAVTEFLHEVTPTTYAAGGLNGEFATGPMDTFPAIPGVEPMTGEAKILSALTIPDPNPEGDSSFGWIGYLSSSAAEFGSLGVVRIVDPNSVNTAGVVPAPASFTAAFAEATLRADGSYKFDYTPTDPNAYPLTTISSMVVPKTAASGSQVKTFESFVTWAVTTGQTETFLPHGYAPLPNEASAEAIRVSKLIQQPVLPVVATASLASDPAATIPTTIEAATTAPLAMVIPTAQFDSGAPAQTGPQPVIEVVRLSAFADPSLKSSGAGSFALVALLGLFMASTLMTFRTRK
jgi:phosphate transport system substrate-binding protein